MPADLKTYAVLGMQLADVTPELKSAYDLYHDDGAVILDPGKDSDRLTRSAGLPKATSFVIGRPGKRIGSVREFVDQILAETAGQNAEEYSVRVVYNFSTVDGRRDEYAVSETDERRPEAVANRVGPAHARAAVISNDSWPGNIRELQSVLKQAILQSYGETLLPGSFVRDTTPNSHAALPGAPSAAFRSSKVISRR